MRTARYLAEAMEASARVEEFDLPEGEFVGRCGKMFRRIFTALTAILSALGVWAYASGRRDVAYLFAALAVIGILILPSILSYKCIFTKQSVTEECLIVFFKYRKEVFWRDVKYKKLRGGEASYLVLYDRNKKRLATFDSGTVGFTRIVKKVKHVPKLK